MTIGKSVRDQGGDAPEGGSKGIKADGEMEGSSYNPLGNPGMEHWQATYVSRGGLEDRGNVFFAAIAMTRMPMIITDPRQPDNPIVFANGAFLDLTGYPESQILGRNCRFLQGTNTNRDTVAEIRQGIDQQRAVAVDILNYKADGSPFWNGLYMGPVFDASGALLYYFASQLDITEKYNAYQSSIQSQKMEAIGALTAGLAHDFNNLLHIANGNLEMAKRQIHGSDAAVEALERSSNALEKATRLTQQLLTFARKQNLQPKTIALNQVALTLTDMLAPTLAPAITMRLDLGTNMPPCQVDPDHLETALLNLVMNAKEAMPDGGTINLSTAVVAAPPLSRHTAGAGREYVEIVVRDQGTGMSEEVARRATEPFFTTKGPGTGLGLAMVHGFAEQSQGTLHIDSTVGEGTAVSLRFPVAGASPATAGPTSRGAAPADVEVPPSRWRAKNILVVDDNADILTLTTQFLSTQGYAVEGVSSGEAALDYLAQGHQVDLMFTDIVMPGGMNGIELARRVSQQYPHIKMLAATGYMDQLPAHADAGVPLQIVPKPFRFDMLEDKIRKLVM